MKFVCLGYADLSQFSRMKEAELAESMEKCFAYDDELRKGGHFAAGEALQPTNQAKTLRFHNGKVVVTDGPYIETKEQIGGILFLEARDMNHAIELMIKHPGVGFGPFEIRPADELTNALIKERDSAFRPASDVELILQVFEDHLVYLEQALANVPDKRFVDQPNGHVNHPAWTLSHLNVSLQLLLHLLDDPQSSLTELDQRRYGPGSIPTTNRSDYETKEILLQQLRTLHQRVLIAVRAKHQTYFQREAPENIRSFAPTIGRIAVYLLASHESYHLAQLNRWRIAAGINESTLSN